MDYYNIPTKIDNDPLIGYEKNSWVDTLKLPLIFGLAFWVALKKKIFGPNLKINTFWFDGASPTCKKVKENATTWRALDIIYNYSPGKDKSFSGRITDFWNNLKNIKAVRNRLRLIKKQLRENIKKFINNDQEKEIRLVSIASGSAQGVIEVMKEFKQKGIFIKAIFLDKDPTAIEYSKNLARKAGVFDRITFVNKSTTDLESVVSGFRPHIIEVTGLLEYRPNEKALNLLKRIQNFLTSGGVLLTSNIAPNPERYFSYWVGNWPLIYRTERELSELVVKAGFNTKNCQIIKEPLKFHNIVICVK
jgi:hypothetical protein